MASCPQKTHDLGDSISWTFSELISISDVISLCSHLIEWLRVDLLKWFGFCSLISFYMCV
jgi:hypothetical protein